MLQNEGQVDGVRVMKPETVRLAMSNRLAENRAGRRIDWDHRIAQEGIVARQPVRRRIGHDRFLQMLQNEGQVDGVRVMKPETVRLAMSNLLPWRKTELAAGSTGTIVSPRKV
jgi:cytoskeletal protein CcmA (bactofilin family)